MLRLVILNLSPVSGGGLAITDQGKPTTPKDVDGQLAPPKAPKSPNPKGIDNQPAPPKAHKPSIRPKVREDIDDSNKPPKINKNQKMRYSNKNRPDDKKVKQHTEKESEDGCYGIIFYCTLVMLCCPLFSIWRVVKGCKEMECCKCCGFED